MSDRIVIDVDRDGWTKNLQLNIAKLDENNRGMGYRLAGPKYNGSSVNLLRTELDERDAGEIRQALDAVFPLPPVSPSRAEVLRAAADHAESLRQFEHATGARWSAQVSENVGILRVADDLRRLADEAEQEEQSGGVRRD